jgi:hypothetical protein
MDLSMLYQYLENRCQMREMQFGISVRWYKDKVMLVVVLEVLDDDIDQLGNNVSRNFRLADQQLLFLSRCKN